MTALVTATVTDVVEVGRMATSATQERLTAARKRARDKLAAERLTAEKQVMAFHQAELDIEDLTEQLAKAQTRRDVAIDVLIASGRTPDQVADLLGVDAADIGKRRAKTSGS